MRFFRLILIVILAFAFERGLAQSQPEEPNPEIRLTKSVHLFPNPATSRLSIVIDAPQKDNISFEVLDAVGRLIKVQRNAVEAGSNTIQLNVSSLAMGTYFIKVSCTNNCETTITRFVKE